MQKKSFLNYINIFRGLAILLIIAGHSMQFGNGLTLKINNEIFCGGTALFIFISGFLFQHLSAKFEYKNYLAKKWTNVIVPYIITAVPGILFCLYCPVLYKNTFAGLTPAIQIPLLLSIGRVHNTPTWFIPMIVLFFFCSWVLLELDKKGILYKLLPVFFLITLVIQRGDIEYDMVINLSTLDKYFAYVKYILLGFVHFFSLYVFGMFCSKYKQIIPKFYSFRVLVFVLMIASAIVDIYLPYKNFTVSKTFLTMLLLGYLEHYDACIIKHEKLNKTLDFIAKYSFGLFFIHWYFIFIYNQIFHLKGVLDVTGSIFAVVLIALVRFLVVTLLSLGFLYTAKKALIKIKDTINTRMFLGV